MIGSARLRLTWLVSLLVLAAVCLVGLRGPGAEGTGWVFLGIRLEPGFDVHPVLMEHLGRSIYVAVAALILFGGFQALLAEGSGPSGPARMRSRIAHLGRACLEGLFMSQAFLLPAMAIAYRGFSPSGDLQVWKDLLRADLNGCLLGFQLLFWAGVVASLLRSNPWLGVLGAYLLLFLGRLASWAVEWGEDLAMPGTLMIPARGLVRVLPVEVMPFDPLAWDRAMWALGTGFVLALIVSVWPSRPTKKKPT